MAMMRNPNHLDPKKPRFWIFEDLQDHPLNTSSSERPSRRLLLWRGQNCLPWLSCLLIIRLVSTLCDFITSLESLQCCRRAKGNHLYSLPCYQSSQELHQDHKGFEGKLSVHLPSWLPGSGSVRNPAQGSRMPKNNTNMLVYRPAPGDHPPCSPGIQFTQ